MIGQLYADLEEIENLGIDLTYMNAVKHAAKQHGYGQVETIVSNFPKDYIHLIRGWFASLGIQYAAKEDK
ncbi:hypothetical protein [Actinotignum sanguinis]|uniref:hypothetical protein n=1 Tax=Actinotignum sanguinis TaxID=1445614 RepID=UPI00254D14B6|nr:hypothetical protein [Actinotignum sanguinis]MDK8352357.1 hypothetical protein [Actinotignum sanguinis]